jgi:hypothetical protein
MILYELIRVEPSLYELNEPKFLFKLGSFNKQTELKSRLYESSLRVV